jgi:hypothetical protein
MFIFNRFHLLNPDFGPVVAFLDCLLHRGHCAFSKMRWPDDWGPVWEGPDLSTGLGSGHPAAFLPMPNKMSKADTYRALRNADPDEDARSVVRCCTCIPPFYSAGARADARIRVVYYVVVLQSSVLYVFWGGFSG